MIIKIIIGIIAFILILIAYSSCIISGRCSREEEKISELNEAREKETEDN